MTKTHTQEKQAPGPILCAVDASTPSDAALQVATSLAEALGRPLHLVHVWQGAVETFGEGRARRFLQDAGRDAKAEGTHFETDVTVNGIASVADRVDAGLVVMGTHSRGRFGRLLLGSTANEILERARWPLLVVRTETVWPPEKIVVGLDNSEAAAQASDLAASIGSAYEAQVTLVEAVPELVMTKDRQDPRGRKAAAIVNRTRSHLAERAQAVTSAGAASPRTTIRLVKPERALEDEIKRGDRTLVVIGHRSSMERRDSEDTSVAESLVCGTHAPILIYPEEAMDRPRHVPTTADEMA